MAPPPNVRYVMILEGLAYELDRMTEDLHPSEKKPLTSLEVEHERLKSDTREELAKVKIHIRAAESRIACVFRATP